jgi:hypothetical protein
MHRMKIGLIAAGLLLTLTALFYLAVTKNLVESATRDVDDRVARAQRIHQQVSRLHGMDRMTLAVSQGRRPGVVRAVTSTDSVQARRQAAFDECNKINEDLAKVQAQAAMVAIIGSDGKVLARDLNPDAEYGEPYGARFPAVAAALKGQAVFDIWTLQGRVTEVGVAPVVRPDGTVGGALLVGYVPSAKRAQQLREILGTEIAFFREGKVYTSSLVSEGTGDDAKEDTSKVPALTNVLFSGPALAKEALEKHGATPRTHQTIDGAEYAMVAAPLPGNFDDKSSGVLLLSSVSDAANRARTAAAPLLMLGLLAIVVALVASVMTAKRFIRPLDQIELGVGEVINGNIDYTFKPVGPDFEGLSNSLNVMLARLLGRDEPNEDAVEEEETEVEKWKAESMVIDEGDGAPSPGAQAMGQEGEASYYPRLYNEYLAALRATGKPTEGVSVQQFMAKLRLAEAGLKQKWTCKMVRFQMLTQGDQIVFRAVRID